ncbi:MAG: tRNA lysidine(34) synthetase TilS [Opitutaceae bacterium]|nr:tRNA lysidine(34) synthetase TilS [Opitutaceae bacterium]
MTAKAKGSVRWRRQAALLGRRLPKSMLHPAVVAWADARPPSERWAVAFSGGPDSLSLLLLLWAHWPERRANLLVLHFNHRLRGRAADGDELFCREVCAALHVDWRAGRWENPPAKASEEAAREARIDFFDQELKAAECGVLWLGHQLNDVAETMVMRLGRGSGTAGLAAPRPVQIFGDGRVHLRPLLALAKKPLLAALRAAGAGWREDRTNRGGDFLRTRLRRRVLPAWQEADGRDVLAGAAWSRQLMEDDDTALEAWLDDLWPQLARKEGMNLRPLVGKPRGLWRRALRRWLGSQADFSRTGFEALLAACQEGVATRLSAGQRGYLVVNGGWLRWELPAQRAPGYEISLALSERRSWPGGGRVSAKGVVLDAAARKRILAGKVRQKGEAFLAPVCEGEGFTVRCWQPGDRYQPLGAAGPVKLQSLFTNRKIGRSKRQSWPVFCRGHGEIVWVPGFGPAEKFKLGIRTKRAVRLTYTEGTSTVTP